MRPETWACVTGGDGRGDISAARGGLTGRSPGLPGRGSARPRRPQSPTRRTPAAPAQAPHGHERQLCQPLMEPCESRSGGAVFAVLVVSAQPQDGGRCLLGPTLRNEVEVVICDIEHVETAAVGRVRVVDLALGVLYKDADPGGLGGKRPGAA